MLISVKVASPQSIESNENAWLSNTAKDPSLQNEKIESIITTNELCLLVENGSVYLDTGTEKILVSAGSRVALEGTSLLLEINAKPISPFKYQSIQKTVAHLYGKQIDYAIDPLPIDRHTHNNDRSTSTLNNLIPEFFQREIDFHEKMKKETKTELPSSDVSELYSSHSQPIEITYLIQPKEGELITNTHNTSHDPIAMDGNILRDLGIET